MIKYLKIYFIALTAFCFQLSSFAQTGLFMPLNIQKAYEKGTRNYDGTPGENYWQNSSDYKIKVSVEPPSRLVSGKENIIYYNNSPDTLKEIVFNLYQNAFKPGAKRDVQINPKLLTEGINISKLLIRRNEINIDSNVIVSGTYLTLKLIDPLPPNSNIELELEWTFTIPNGKAWRMGKIDSTTFFVAYWFPHIAVYDDIQGWNRYNHTGQSEFYNDFSNFDVEITVPNTFSVWSTGVLQNPSQLFKKEYLKRYEKAHESDTVINIISKEDLNKEIYNSNNLTNIWHYKAENVTDFAFGISDHYLWDAVSLVVDKEKNKRVYATAAYDKEAKDFYKAAEVVRKSIKYFSYELPGVPFPYPALTDFNGNSGGMEFPMIINDQSVSTYRGLVSLTSHEIAHNYFPFYMGINEKKYAWMDEGMATFIPIEFQIEEGKDTVIERNVSGYQKFAGQENEVPSVIPSFLLSGTPYRNASYRKPGLAYYYLRSALGKEKFDKAFHEYMARWNGKHPIPYDFFFTFNEVTGENLNWYWKPWFFEKGYPDLAVKNVVQDDDSIKILVEKEGKIPVPVYLKITGNNSEKEINKSVEVWKKGEKEIWITENINFKYESVKLGNSKIPDVDKSNNFYKPQDNKSFLHGKPN